MSDDLWLLAENARLRGRNAEFEVAAVPLFLAGYRGNMLQQVEAVLAELAALRAREPRRCFPCAGLAGPTPSKDCPECHGRGAVWVTP